MARKKGSSSETTRPRIRAAAARLFAQSGYGAVTMRSIAGEVGLQAGALYRYFDDKESLAADLLDEAVGARDAALPAALPGDPAAAFAAYVAAYANWRIARVEDAAMIALLSTALGRDHQSTVELHLHRLLEAAETAGAAKLPDTRAGAAAILAVLDRIAADDRLPRDRRLRIAARFAERIAGM